MSILIDSFYFWQSEYWLVLGRAQMEAWVCINTNLINTRFKLLLTSISTNDYEKGVLRCWHGTPTATLFYGLLSSHSFWQQLCLGCNDGKSVPLYSLFPVQTTQSAETLADPQGHWWDASGSRLLVKHLYFLPNVGIYKQSLRYLQIWLLFFYLKNMKKRFYD